MAEQAISLPSTAVPFVDDKGNITPPWQRVLQSYGYANVPVGSCVLIDATLGLNLLKSWVVEGGLVAPIGYVYIKRIN